MADLTTWLEIKFDVRGMIKEFDYNLINRIHNAQKEAMKKMEKMALGFYSMSVKTWEHQPRFITTAGATHTIFFLEIGSDSPIFHWVDKGTPSHLIVPVQASILAFQGGYTAKTVPWMFGSGQGGPFGDTVFAKVVWHPGIEPRRFTEQVFNIIKWEGPDIMSAALRKWVNWS